MSISVFVLIIIAATAALALTAAAYLMIYTRSVNKALVTKGCKHLRMIPPYKVVIALSVMLMTGVTALGILYLPGMKRITTAHDIEQKMRQRQAADEGWNVEVAMSDDLAAALAYNDELTDYTFAVYRNRNDLLTNYEFKYGGSTASVAESVRVFKYDGTLALLSMNALHIAKIACHDGNIYEVEPDLPFVLIMPSGGFDVYDRAGKSIVLESTSCYEMTTID